MSYSSAYSIDYQTTPSYTNSFLLPRLTDSSTSVNISSNSGALTSGDDFLANSVQLNTGIYLLRFVGAITASANTVLISSATATITPASGLVVVSTMSIITPPDGGFIASAGTPYYFTLTDNVSYVVGDQNDPTTFTLNVTWSGAGTVTCTDMDCSYTKIT